MDSKISEQKYTKQTTGSHTQIKSVEKCLITKENVEILNYI